MDHRNTKRIILWGIAAVVFAAGAVLVGVTLSGQREVIQQAAAQGVAQAQITDYIWKQVVPQLLRDGMSTLAFAGILVGLGMLCAPAHGAGMPPQSLLPGLEEPEEENFYAEFEVVDPEGKR